jgi:hypothetical protein
MITKARSIRTLEQKGQGLEGEGRGWEVHIAVLVSGLSTALCWIIKSLNVPGCQPSDLNRAQNTHIYRRAQIHGGSSRQVTHFIQYLSALVSLYTTLHPVSLGHYMPHSI